MSAPKPILVGARPYHITGRLRIVSADGRVEEFQYGTGGYGRGSMPYGVHQITPGEEGDWGKRHGAIGVDYNSMRDPKYSGEREGIEIHRDYGGLRSAGCLVIDRFDEAKRKIMEMVRAGQAFLHLLPGLAVITAQKTLDRVVVFLPGASKKEVAEVHVGRVRVASHRHPHYARHRHTRYAGA